MATYLLDADNISMSFGGLRALSDCNLKVKEGEIHSLIGPNGAGKTTLFNIITGIYRPDSGKVTFSGVDITGRKPHEITPLGISRTFQNIELFPSLNPIENVMVGMTHIMKYGFFSSAFLRSPWKKEEKRARERARELLLSLGVQELHMTANVKDLPYGIQKRVEIARALSQNPRLLLLDEPSGGLNPSETESLMETIRSINKELGITVLLVEHDMKVVMGLSDTITVINFGKNIAVGPPEEIQKNEEVIRAYLGKKKASNS